MPRQNRVTPYGELVATPERGLFWGNRGSLLDSAGEPVRYATTRAWLICLLEFKGRRRQVWTPGRLTELFFLDEATGLAAGHRPCGECRRDALTDFKSAWATAFPGAEVSAPAIDARLQQDRLSAPRRRRAYLAPVGGLPDGTMVDLGGRPHLVLGGRVLPWSHGGYGPPASLPAGEVAVITPRATVAVLAAGYRPVLHPSASGTGGAVGSRV